MAKKTQTPATIPAAPAPAPEPAPAPAAAAKKVNNFQATATLSFEIATPEEIATVPEATRQSYGLRSLLVGALKDLAVRGGIVVKDQEFKKLRGRVSSINRNKLIQSKDAKGAELVHKFYVREHEGKTFVIRES